MCLPFVFLVIFSATYGLNEYYDLATNLEVASIQGVPCLLLAAISWLWPRRGGVLAIALSLLLLALSTSAIMTSKAPAPGQEYPAELSLAEISIYILPYAILLFGSILAFVLASVREARSPGLLPRLRAGAAGVNKLRVTGLTMMFSLGVLYILLFIAAIAISGDSVPAANLFTGLILGLTFATLLLLIIIAVWRWPRRGSTAVGGLSLAALIFLAVQLVSADSSFPRLLPIPFIFAATIVLAGSILVFISAKRH